VLLVPKVDILFRGTRASNRRIVRCLADVEPTANHGLRKTWLRRRTRVVLLVRFELPMTDSPQV
jgi:hypothetical protein